MLIWLKRNKVMVMLLVILVFHVAIMRAYYYSRDQLMLLPFSLRIIIAISLVALSIFWIIRTKKHHPEKLKTIIRINRGILILIIAHYFFIKIFYRLKLSFPETPVYGILAIVLLFAIIYLFILVRIKGKKSQKSSLFIEKMRRMTTALSLMFVVAIILYVMREI